MSTMKDRLHDARLMASDARVRLSNGWHRVAGRRICGQRTRISNWRNRRTLARGRRPRLIQAAGQLRSRTPLYRDRVNRATGRPHRDDARLGRIADRSLAQVKTTPEAAPPWARARGRRRDLGFWSAYEQGSRAVLESRLPRPPRQGRGSR